MRLDIKLKRLVNQVNIHIARATPASDMRKEYDFSDGIRGKYMSKSDDQALDLYVPRMLDSLGQEDFDVSMLKWKQKDFTLIRLGDMDDKHLRNTALMLMGMGYQTYKASDRVKIKWLTALRMEWEKRMYERKRTQSATNHARVTFRRRGE